MKLYELKKLHLDKVCIYEAIDYECDSNVKYEDDYTGKFENIPNWLLHANVVGIYAKRKGMLGIQIE